MTGDIGERLARLMRPEVLAQPAYHVPDAGGLVKLDAMENPYAWPAPALDAAMEVWRSAPLNRYPDPAATALRAALATAFATPPGSAILLGNGSDELIQMLLMALGGQGGAVLAPEPSFVMYRSIAAWLGLPYIGVPLGPDFVLDEAAMLAAIARHRPALVFIANPNNPTGNLFDGVALQRIIAAAPGAVVVDEAYAPFTDFTALPWLARFPQLLVMRTLSKMGLAGLRLGWLCGDPRWLDAVNKLRLPYNINVLTQQAALAALARRADFDAQAAAIRAERTALGASLAALPGVRVWSSEANFLLFSPGTGRGPEVFAALKQQGVLIKNLHGAHPQLMDCLRVTVGTPEENQRFLAALRASLPPHG
jgi:histidinol-phosphate aminotransferase